MTIRLETVRGASSPADPARDWTPRGETALLHRRDFGGDEFAHAGFRVGERNFALVEFRQQRFLRGVILVRHAGFALEHAPGFSPFDGKSALYRDGVAYWMTVEPALDYSIPTVLLFAQEIGEPPLPVLKAAALTNTMFSFDLTGSTGFSFIVQSSSNLNAWTPLQTNTTPFSFIDSNAANSSPRFYRALYFR